jgi:hypothetical protein
MNRFQQLVVCWLALTGCAVASNLKADVVFLASGQTLYGRVLAENAGQVTLRQRIPGSVDYRRMEIPRSEITTLVINIRPAELEQLHPDQPSGYRDQAELLASQKQDPEARDLAIRLYLLAAAYGDSSLRRDSFAGLISLARSPDEEKRFRALAHITLDDETNWLAPVPATPGPQPPAEAALAARRQLAEALENLRSGRRQDAVDVIEQPWVREILPPFESICSWQQLRSFASEPELKTEWLAKTLELEIALRDVNHAAPANDTAAAGDWSRLVTREHGLNVPLSFDNVTEIDVSKNVFRNDEWIRADEGDSVSRDPGLPSAAIPPAAIR